MATKLAMSILTENYLRESIAQQGIQIVKLMVLYKVIILFKMPVPRKGLVVIKEILRLQLY
ncbi:hypothetical protein KFO32_06295 [Pantoea ananatis]|uniref:hypothetical protein n=1 Tax=Pantoea ananas TaxID=553 RepID=UPI000490AAF4|nr:hypothetical protein [Pantoea ananatis]MCK0552682.1 hypothetical protein [Pantoea ananatis]UYL04014.1 hypothetical protein NG830_10375 [Pantoea ananatis]